ncbi:MAG: peptidylprolyl isomerase [Deltaproteobacteria bacterium]|nr:peptidylprolyl isomerase [Deltaproteobacteria bacterium]
MKLRLQLRCLLLVAALAVAQSTLVWGTSALAVEKPLPFPLPRSAQELPRSAVIETEKGSFRIEFLREVAPTTVRNFEYLAKRNFYSGLTFHRYEPGFAIQGGDPKGNGKGGPGYMLPPEFSNVRHERGSLGMARLSDQINPERLSNGSQFYICLAPAPHIDGLYTVFANVRSGMDVVERLRKGDRIISVRVEP